MSLFEVPSGRAVPDDINVIVEIPMHSEPVKYEMDKATRVLFVDRVLTTAMQYPCNYGYVPHTLCGDGDPLDALVVMPVPVQPGCVIRARPVGVLKMTDESGEDAKLITVPHVKVFPAYAGIHSMDDLNPMTLERIAHFFAHYKDLEEGKWVRIEGWEGIDSARAEITNSQAMCAEAVKKAESDR
ncbi:MAG: inorganic diphosphatase [Salinisphaera sp.]|nr:inorganic diphosphatase [Salinisphaera sp.]MDN5937489.1 inorganic diphosphatase [Salinisphaera sp.]